MDKTLDFNGSTPSISQFNPHAVPYQYQVINDIRSKFDYSKGVHEIMLSGSVGSAKSLLLAHLIVTHCLLYPKAKALIGRKTFPDLRETLILKIIDHMMGDLIEGRDFKYHKGINKFIFSNGSEIIARSWADKNFKRFRSLELSCAAVEELTENDNTVKGFYDELFQRVGRLPHVPEKFIISATNPDAPTHWAYQHFIGNPKGNRKVYYSVTTDNKFLPQSYIQTLKETLDPRMARRMIHGEWLEISQEVIYHNYSTSKNFIDHEYTIRPDLPIDISHDFNIGIKKPMSCCVSQKIGSKFHFFKVFAIEGARTSTIMDEMAAFGIFEHKNKFRVFGDSTGKSRDTRSIKSDYDIIREFYSNYKRADGSFPEVEYLIPIANPPIRERHNLLNAVCCNALGEVNLHIYKGAELLDEGLRLTKLKNVGGYAEDDSFHAQHVTTAAGYMIHYLLKRINTIRETYRR